ncbi:hypothetical protein RJ641_019124 [Dillenia turbinata]|uniref:Uncharacterized protein n=1 Tax=Dillenia turbinata TaxID=194707 RepID=A0AAN8Z0I2_9MAGN
MQRISNGYFHKTFRLILKIFSFIQHPDLTLHSHSPPNPNLLFLSASFSLQMEDPETSTETQLNNKGEEENGMEEEEEFYEKIEAPKFVDFTLPGDPYHPDDRYWFCTRLGCDQKHEEELDLEAVNKNFILRVMAARSPNIRLRKALTKRSPSSNMKCPLTVPAKPSKSRISKLAVISSISQKRVVAKANVRSLPKINSTPMAKPKQPSVAGKALTTPRNRKCPEKPNAFRSVRNSKPTIAIPKNRVVAKALIFHSPMKDVRKKASVELETPVKKICEGMKKLQITSQSKPILGYAKKLSRNIRNDPSKAQDSPRRKMGARQVKSRFQDSLYSRIGKREEVKSSRSLKRKSNEISTCCKDDSNNMDIDEKSSRISLENHHGSLVSSDCTGKPTVKTPVLSENREGVLSGAEESNVQRSADAHKEKRENKGIRNKEQKAKSEPVRGHTSPGCAAEMVEHCNEMVENDDKENASTSDDNREMIHKNKQSGRNIAGGHDNYEKTAKVFEAEDKNLKKATAASCVQGAIHKKPKPTKTKPFRLRTDERGILKEANLEKRAHLLAPVKENNNVLVVGNSLRRQESENHGAKKFLGEKKNTNKHESGEKELKETTEKDHEENFKSLNKKTSAQIVQKKPSITSQKGPIQMQKIANLLTSKLDSGKDVIENRSRNTRSPLLQQFAKSNRPKSSQLGVIKEKTSSREDEVVRDPSENHAIHTTKSSVPTDSRSLSRGKRPLTVPREPNFQCLHTPKSCTRKLG